MGGDSGDGWEDSVIAPIRTRGTDDEVLTLAVHLIRTYDRGAIVVGWRFAGALRRLREAVGDRVNAEWAPPDEYSRAEIEERYDELCDETNEVRHRLAQRGFDVAGKRLWDAISPLIKQDTDIPSVREGWKRAEAFITGGGSRQEAAVLAASNARRALVDTSFWRGFGRYLTDTSPPPPAKPLSP